jgi:DNA-directed RNA polymerase I subunit RPA1
LCGCADGSVVQFYYGEDGLDVSKTKWMDKFKFLASNYHAWPETKLNLKHTPNDKVPKFNQKSAKRYKQHQQDKTGKQALRLY